MDSALSGLLQVAAGAGAGYGQGMADVGKQNVTNLFTEKREQAEARRQKTLADLRGSQQKASDERQIGARKDAAGLLAGAQVKADETKAGAKVTAATQKQTDAMALQELKNKAISGKGAAKPPSLADINRFHTARVSLENDLAANKYPEITPALQARKEQINALANATGQDTIKLEVVGGKVRFLWRDKPGSVATAPASPGTKPVGSGGSDLSGYRKRYAAQQKPVTPSVPVVPQQPITGSSAPSQVTPTVQPPGLPQLPAKQQTQVERIAAELQMIEEAAMKNANDPEIARRREMIAGQLQMPADAPIHALWAKVKEMFTPHPDFASGTSPLLGDITR